MCTFGLSCEAPAASGRRERGGPALGQERDAFRAGAIPTKKRSPVTPRRPHGSQEAFDVYGAVRGQSLWTVAFAFDMKKFSAREPRCGLRGVRIGEASHPGPPKLSRCRSRSRDIRLAGIYLPDSESDDEPLVSGPSSPGLPPDESRNVALRVDHGDETVLWIPRRIRVALQSLEDDLRTGNRFAALRAPEEDSAQAASLGPVVHSCRRVAVGTMTTLGSYHFWPAQGLTTFGPHHFWPKPLLLNMGPNLRTILDLGQWVCCVVLCCVVFCSVLLCCVVVCRCGVHSRFSWVRPRFGRSQTPPPPDRPSTRPPKIAVFFSSPATIFFLSSLSLGSFRGILVVFEEPAALAVKARTTA